MDGIFAIPGTRREKQGGAEGDGTGLIGHQITNEEIRPAQCPSYSFWGSNEESAVKEKKNPRTDCGLYKNISAQKNLFFCLREKEERRSSNQTRKLLLLKSLSKNDASGRGNR